MRALIQRVSHVRVEGETVGAIGPGLLVLVDVARADGPEDVSYLAGKIPHLRLFSQRDQHFSLSILDSGGSVLVVSQFTLYAETRKGRRPSFSLSAPGDQAAPLIESLASQLQAAGLHVETGRFGALMQVELVNEGPVTLVLER